jgi:hypothetical protein
MVIFAEVAWKFRVGMDVKEFLMKLLRRRGRELLFNAEAVRGTNSIFSEMVGNPLIG